MANFHFERTILGCHTAWRLQKGWQVTLCASLLHYLVLIQWCHDNFFCMMLRTIIASSNEQCINLNDNTTTSLASQIQVTSFRSMLFWQCLSGIRVIAHDNNKCSSGHIFKSLGSSTNNYPHYYTTSACANGLLHAKVNVFFIWLGKSPKEWKKSK